MISKALIDFVKKHDIRVEFSYDERFDTVSIRFHKDCFGCLVTDISCDLKSWTEHYNSRSTEFWEKMFESHAKDFEVFLEKEREIDSYYDRLELEEQYNTELEFPDCCDEITMEE